MANTHGARGATHERPLCGLLFPELFRFDASAAPLPAHTHTRATQRITKPNYKPIFCYRFVYEFGKLPKLNVCSRSKPNNLFVESFGLVAHSHLQSIGLIKASTTMLLPLFVANVFTVQSFSCVRMRFSYLSLLSVAVRRWHQMNVESQCNKLCRHWMTESGICSSRISQKEEKSIE